MIVLNTAVARQYIQCASPINDERLVVNLNDHQSTLFMTNGVHLPDSDRIAILKNINLFKKTQDFTFYRSINHSTEEIVRIPNEFIGEYTNYFKVSLAITKLSNNYTFNREYSCFSAIYND